MGAEPISSPSLPFVFQSPMTSIINNWVNQGSCGWVSEEVEITVSTLYHTGSKPRVCSEAGARRTCGCRSVYESWFHRHADEGKVFATQRDTQCLLKAEDGRRHLTTVKTLQLLPRAIVSH